jgi:hypothetical protein
MASKPSIQDVADALGLTLERQHVSGAPWCPPRDGEALRHWVTDRTGTLGSGIRRAVRLARLMALADGRDYTSFLYLRLSALRTSQFRSLLQIAAKERRLPVAVVMVTETGVTLNEPALAAVGRPLEGFEIDYAQMPRLAALLDFMHNALGFGVVADLLAPVCRNRVPPGSANEVGRALHASLNAWLADRLESANHIRQGQFIRAFLGSRGRVVPESIDDEAILVFWEKVGITASEDGIEGFRLYRSSAVALLRYRQSLRDATISRQLENSFSQGLDGPELSSERDESTLANQNAWQSPLNPLTLPPADRVKWLTRKEQHSLLNYLGGTAESDDERPDGEADRPWDGGLADRERFDLSFLLTLLRSDVFGGAQASIVARLRKRARADDAITQAMSGIDDQAYAIAANAYHEIREQVHLECQAALAILMEAGAAEAVVLLDFLAGPETVKAIVGSFSLEEDEIAEENLRAKISLALRRAFSDPNSVAHDSARQLLQASRSIGRKVNRSGFRREDRTDADALAALQAGAPAAVELIHELDRLGSALLRQRPGINTDRMRFLQAFQRAYAPTASA